MKLRTKLIWAGIVVVLIPMLLSAGMMWVLIQWQNTEDAKQRSGNITLLDEVTDITSFIVKAI